jgi:hypothetical protein
MTYALEIANGWELAFEVDLVLTPTPRTPCDWTDADEAFAQLAWDSTLSPTPCDWTPIQTEPEDLSQFDFTTFTWISGLELSARETPVVKQTALPFLEQVHQGLTVKRNGMVWNPETNNHPLRPTHTGRYRSIKRNIPYELRTDEFAKAWFADIPRGYKGAVKETIRFHRILDGLGKHHGYTKKTDRKVNMKLVNKTM